jgi:hypothetical protein
MEYGRSRCVSLLKKQDWTATSSWLRFTLLIVSLWIGSPLYAADWNICTHTGSSDTTGTLYDSGGAAGNYGNSENCSFLISPGGSPAQITLSFSAFSTEFGFLTSMDTDANGQYSFTGLSAAIYSVRVVNSTVTSSRSGADGSQVAVQTFLADGDSGANDLLNYPVITAATVTGTTISIDLDLDVPAGDYRIEFFKNPSGADPSGYGEGERFAGAASISHPGGGTQSFSHSFSGFVGDSITATTTIDSGGGSYGSTSEFSFVFRVKVR